MHAGLSLRGRFLLAAGVMIAVVVALTLHVNHVLLLGLVTQNLDAKIDSQIEMLQLGIGPQGQMQAGNLHLMPHFQNAPLRWGWQVDGAGHAAGGTPLATARVVWRGAASGQAIESGTGVSLAGVPMHFRRKTVMVRGRPLRIVVAAPEQLLSEAMDAAINPTEVAVGLMSVALLILAYLQLFYSLQPVFALRDAVARVREGRLRRLPGGQPRELAPFADELNALLDQNEAGLEFARHHVGNLAHGLKTPLATLTLRLAREGASAATRALVADMAQRIDHHLNRARAAACTTGERASADLAAVASALALALSHLHEARGVAITIDPSATGSLAVDPADLDEMLGNLMDNACRFAGGQVRLRARLRGTLTELLVEDDGPGIPASARTRALALGSRLDESGQGYGLGLGIVRELAELYGGHLVLETAEDLGGLRAVLALPCRIEAPPAIRPAA